MESVVSKIRFVRSFFTGEYCLKTDKGKRLTKWFKEYDRTVIGDFVKVETDIGTFIYHKKQAGLLYEQYGDDEDTYVYKLTEDIYYMQINCSDYMSLVQLYKSDGIVINMSALEDVCPIGNDLIAAKEFCGNWGILDKDLNWKVSPIYDEIYEFRNGFASGLIRENYTTDLISVDENGDLHIVNVEGYAVDYLTPDIIRTTKNNKCGAYNTKGEKILDIVYDDINVLRNHFVLKKRNLYGIADITGKILYECKYFQIYKTEKGFKLVTRQIIDTEQDITV